LHPSGAREVKNILEKGQVGEVKKKFASNGNTMMKANSINVNKY